MKDDAACRASRARSATGCRPRRRCRASTGGARLPDDAARCSPPVTSWRSREWACIELMKPHLDWPREQTLGTHVNLSHIAATPPGLTVEIRARLAAVEGRKLVFAVRAHDGVDTISEGTHERHVIDAERFERKVAAKARARRRAHDARCARRRRSRWRSRSRGPPPAQRGPPPAQPVERGRRARAAEGGAARRSRSSARAAPIPTRRTARSSATARASCRSRSAATIASTR